MAIYQEESFGPVKGIVRVTNIGESIACANGNEYGSSAAVFGKDAGWALKWQNVLNRVFVI